MRLHAFAAPVLALFALAACADSPTAPAAAGPATPVAAHAAERHVEEVEYDLTGTRIGCTEEGVFDVIRITGAIRERYTTIVLPTEGRVNLRASDPHGLSGTGERTGEAYRIQVASHSAGISTPELDIGGWRERITFTGTKTGIRYYLDFRVRFVYNEHSQRVIERAIYDSNCYI